MGVYIKGITIEELQFAMLMFKEYTSKLKEEMR